MQSLTTNRGSMRVSLEGLADLDPPAPSPKAAANKMEKEEEENCGTKTVTTGNVERKTQPTQAKNGTGTRIDLMET